MKKIRGVAFDACENLETVVLPNGIQEIFVGTFSGCTNLKNIKMPDSVQKIGEYAFAWCDNLENVSIPLGVTYIADDAFNGSEKLVLNVFKGSYAEKYAEANNIPFEHI